VRPGDVHAYVELHIEQGSVLESAGARIGVVTAIVGMGGGRMEFRGRQDHAGTTHLRAQRPGAKPLPGRVEHLG
jgi:acetylornithine deacetylase/succinyl-diaminopimelate desuccinylase-like protein